MRRIDDHVFIITGGGGAIARSIVRAFAEAGARLALVDRDLEHVREAGEAVGGLALAADLLRPEEAQKMVGAVVAHFGRLDGLIHTVGGFAMGTIEGSAAELYERMFDLNVRTLFFALRAAVPELRRRGGGFVAGFASEPAWTGTAPGTALYGAAKSAVAHLLHSLDAELKDTAVKVAIAYPMGAVDTPANRRDMPDVDPARLIDPDEIAEALLFAATRSPRGRVIELPIFPAR